MAKQTRRMDRPKANGQSIFERQPPCSVETEQCLLGSILLKPNVCDDVASVVHEQDFYDPAHRLLFHHMMDMGHSDQSHFRVQPLVASQRKLNISQIGNVQCRQEKAWGSQHSLLLVSLMPGGTGF